MKWSFFRIWLHYFLCFSVVFCWWLNRIHSNNSTSNCWLLTTITKKIKFKMFADLREHYSRTNSDSRPHWAALGPYGNSREGAEHSGARLLCNLQCKEAKRRTYLWGCSLFRNWMTARLHSITLMSSQLQHPDGCSRTSQALWTHPPIQITQTTHPFAKQSALKTVVYLVSDEKFWAGASTSRSQGNDISTPDDHTSVQRKEMEKFKNFQLKDFGCGKRLF